MMNKLIWQVQPQYANQAQWTALSQREGLFFEPLELSLWPSHEEAERGGQMFRWYRDGGRVRSLHGAFIDINPAGGDPELRALSCRRCHESCRLAAGLGAENVVFHASAHPFLRGTYLDTWAKRCAEFYTELAETYGLNICVENSMDVDCVPLQTLMKQVRDRRVCVCLDVGHAHYSRAPMAEWFDILGEHIRYMHLSDNAGGFDDHLSLGKGTVDWETVHRLWADLKRDMPVTLEVGGMPGVEASLEFMRRHGYFGQGGGRNEY